ncbi:hypothetical protein PGT21_015873 [Puccinia graminis f. sp. tritici]|uniref:Uncharacterized protein n=1 Tax=Puccinia graminis f. sp. tritici TaxID=56615 RepID=A0A5B0S1I8_PUCGR|nr:hypothetical protein PGT21_015873 [Puccinia graminis f. sp. tritici]KAA1131608.1 hypothetical protein PGTUg99_033217 [Puccinia graminis f. sp. tritici]
MLLTKILVAFQLLHYYSVSAHPLSLSANLVKRGEHFFNPVSDLASNGKTVDEGLNIEKGTKGPVRLDHEKAGMEDSNHGLSSLKDGSFEMPEWFSHQMNAQFSVQRKELERGNFPTDFITSVEKDVQQMIKDENIADQIIHMERGRQEEALKNFISHAYKTSVTEHRIPDIPGWFFPYVNKLFSDGRENLQKDGISNDLINSVEEYTLQLLRNEKFAEKAGQIKPEDFDEFINHSLKYFYKIAVENIILKPAKSFGKDS